MCFSTSLVASRSVMVVWYVPSRAVAGDPTASAGPFDGAAMACLESADFTGATKMAAGDMMVYLEGTRADEALQLRVQGVVGL